jgi:hypothetical protein
MNEEQPFLHNLLTAHADELCELLGPLWPIGSYRIDRFGALVKYTLGQMPDGRWAMLHHITAPDGGPPHDHPTQLDSHVIEGSYWETVFHEDGRTERVLRAAGGHHTIWPHTVHTITDLPQGRAWTLAFGHEVVREWRHYPELVA